MRELARFMFLVKAQICGQFADVSKPCNTAYNECLGCQWLAMARKAHLDYNPPAYTLAS